MGETIKGWFGAQDWQGVLDQFSNDKIIEFFTRPLGIGIIAVLMGLSVLFKWRLLFVFLGGSLAVSFLARTTLTNAGGGPNRTLLYFAAGGVAIGAFVIYYLFIRED